MNDKYLELHKKIKNGAKEAETVVQLNSRFATEDAFYVKYTTKYDDKGKPFKAIGTANKLPGYHELEENYYITMHDAGICLWTVDLENRTIIPFSQSFRLYGNIPVEFLSQINGLKVGEYIYPNQEEADAMYNTALLYEMSVLRAQAEPILLNVPRNRPEYAEARRLLNLLSFFKPLSADAIPPTSLLREFLGGSSFKYD